MTDEQFDAHLALHGFVRYDGNASLNITEPRRVYVSDEYLVEMFRDDRWFIRIDQYGSEELRALEERAVPGVQEFGRAGQTFFYTLKK